MMIWLSKTGIEHAKHDDLTAKSRDITNHKGLFVVWEPGFYHPILKRFNEMILLVAQEPGVSIFFNGFAQRR